MNTSTEKSGISNPQFSILNSQLSILPLLLLTAFGCSTSSWKAPDVSALLPAGPPSKVIAIWEPAVQHTKNETKPSRGFAGRVYFYDAGGKRPVKVQGNVVVYAFDEEGRKEDDNAPTRSYVFAASDVKKLYSKSKIGHSYNLWVPWDQDGPEGNVKKVSLIVRYVPEKGSSVVSSQALLYLPGKVGQTQLVAKADWDEMSSHKGAIQQVALLSKKERETPMYEKVIEENYRAGSMQTTTISVPPTIAQNLRKLPPQTVPQPQPQPQPQILPAAFMRPSEEKTVEERSLEEKTLAKTDPMGRGAHALEDRKPSDRQQPKVVVDQGMIRLR